MTPEYPEANGCHDHSTHVLGPWSPLMEAFDSEGMELAIQVAQCLRCGYVTSQAFRAPKAVIEEGLSRGRFLGALDAQPWGMPGPESQLPCADESPDLG